MATDKVVFAFWIGFLGKVCLQDFPVGPSF